MIPGGAVRWSEGLWDPRAGGYRQNEAVGVNLMSTTDIAWIRYAVNEEQLDAGHREPWIRYLQRAQAPTTGVVAYNASPGGHTGLQPSFLCPRSFCQQTCVGTKAGGGKKIEGKKMRGKDAGSEASEMASREASHSFARRAAGLAEAAGATRPWTLAQRDSVHKFM